jgi:hypothetical protein
MERIDNHRFLTNRKFFKIKSFAAYDQISVDAQLRIWFA